MINVHHRLRDLGVCPPASGPAWGTYGSFRRCSLAGERIPLGVGLEGFYPSSLPINFLCFLYTVEI